jgi:hypothetical protein
MDIKSLKTPALIFMAGYGFQYVDHFHKSILAHGYNLALIAGAVYVVCLLNAKANKATKKQEPPRMIESKPVESGHVLKTGQRIVRMKVGEIQ